MAEVTALKPLPDAVLWLDPGLTTGWALLLTNQPDHDGEHQFTAGQVQGRVEAGDHVAKLCELYGDRLSIGWEAYIVGHGSRLTGDPIPSLEVIGATKWLAHHHGVTVLMPVPAASRLIATTNALKALDWWPQGVHAKDAAMHLLAWCLREGHFRERLADVYGGLLARYDKLQEQRKQEQELSQLREDNPDDRDQQ